MKFGRPFQIFGADMLNALPPAVSSLYLGSSINLSFDERRLRRTSFFFIVFDKEGGRVPSKSWKASEATLYSVLALMGSQWR